MERPSVAEKITSREDLIEAIKSGPARYVFSSDFDPAWSDQWFSYEFCCENAQGISPVTKVRYPGQTYLPDGYEDLVRLVLNGSHVTFIVCPENSAGLLFAEEFLATLHLRNTEGPHLWKDDLARKLYRSGAPLVPVDPQATHLATPCVIGLTTVSNITCFKAVEPAIIWSRCWRVEQDLESLVSPFIVGNLPRPVKEKSRVRWNESLDKWVKEAALILHNAVLLNVKEASIRPGEISIPPFPVPKPSDKLIEKARKLCVDEIKALPGSEVWAVNLCRPDKTMFEDSKISFSDKNEVESDRWGHPIGFTMKFGEGTVQVVDRQMPYDLIVGNGGSLSGSQDEVNARKYSHSDDFRSVLFQGVNYKFTTNQARVIQVLWEQSLKGLEAISVDELLDSIDTVADNKNRKMRDVFKKDGKMHEAWKIVIVPAGKGYYKLGSCPS